ncbi:MAG: hypothetical protein HQM15_08430 [Deltaproteobacteria bacterium]|nr:hypothetical protein [Deltaproteobacteria bacterium]
MLKPLIFLVVVAFSLGGGVAWAPVAQDCICPYDETVLTHPGVQSCGQIKCPACKRLMHRALYVGSPRTDRNGSIGIQAPQVVKPAAFGGPAADPPGPTVVAPTASPSAQAPVEAVTYTNTISGTIEVNCSRCHDGPLRNLMTYEKVKTYVDNGLLVLLVRPGGSMNRFAEKDAQVIIDWAKNGALK